MARELQVEVEVLGTAEADAAISRLSLAFSAAGDNALKAAEKAEKFERSYADGAARTRAKKELDALSKAANDTGAAAEKATAKISAKDRALGSFTATVMKFAGPAALGYAIKSTLDWAGSLSDLSKSTGISTTALQKFELIGKASGVTMDQVAQSSLQLSNRVAGGNKSTAEAMRRLGLSMSKMASMSPEDAMLSLANALVKIENPQERVSLAMDIGGKSMSKMLPMLDDMARKWDTTTNVLDGGAIESLDDAGDSIAELTDSGKKLLANVLVQFAPLLNIVAGSLTGFVSSTMPALQNWFNGVIEGFMRVELAFRQFDDNMRNAGLRELDKSDPGRAAAIRQRSGIAQGGFFNDAQLAKDRLGAFKFQDSVVAGSGMPNTPPPFVPDISGGRSKKQGAKVLPFTANQWATIQQVLGPRNPMGNGGLGSFPGWASPDPLQSSMSPAWAQFPGAVPMNAPGGGGLSGMFKGRGLQLGMMAGGLAAQFLPGRVGRVAQGAMGMASQGAGLGAMFGPHGAAVGAGIGALVGGVSSLFGGGGKAKKNAKNAETSAVFEQFSSKEFIEMQKQADKFGISMEKALTAKTMKDFGAAVDEVNGKLTELNTIQSEIDYLTEQTTVGFDKMKAVVNEFGLDISKLGPAFKQQEMDSQAQKIIDAFAIMERGGADMNGVLDGMSDEISTVVQNSIKFGTTIPENMKPWIEKLKASGKLVDENGKAITDIEGLKFGTKMESEMDKLVRKLDELISKLAGVKAGFDGAASSAGDLNDQTNGGSGTGGGNPSGNNESGFATGGVAGRDARRPGHGDIFPALLRRGETVLPPGVHRGGVSLSIGNLSVGGGYSSRSDAVEEIGDAVVRYLERRGKRLVA